MARPNRGCHPRAASERHEIADSNHGSHDGYLGGADQKPDDGTVCDAFEAKILARGQAGRRLAWRRFRRGRHEPDAVLDAIGRTMAKSMGRHDGSWNRRRTAPALIIRPSPVREGQDATREGNGPPVRNSGPRSRRSPRTRTL